MIEEIPECPESISTLDGRILWMETCEDQIKRKRLTPEVLEAAKCYVFTIELSEIAEKMLLKEGHVVDGEINPWNLIYNACTWRIFELDDILGLTPKGRGLI